MIIVICSSDRMADRVKLESITRGGVGVLFDLAHKMLRGGMIIRVLKSCAFVSHANFANINKVFP